MNRPIVLVFARYYLPGYRSGGPARSIANMVERFGDEFHFRIITSDRDIGDNDPYEGIVPDIWCEAGKAEVMYLSARQHGFAGIAKLMQQTPHDLVYLNSFFDAGYTAIPLLLRRLGLTPNKPYVMAPRGEFSPGAIALKASRKRFYLRLIRTFGLAQDVVWQASSAYEASDIKNMDGSATARICIAPNLSSSDSCNASQHFFLQRKPGDPLRIVFLSRISPKKNLHFALRVLRQSQHPIVFDIYGPVTDETYWQRCQAEIKTLPNHVRAIYHGHIPPARVSKVISGYDLFFLPTLGENYGHVIAESLSVGTPILISDTTPWRNLQTLGVGWDLSLNEEASFLHSIQYCIRLNADEYTTWRAFIRGYAAKKLSDPEVVEANRQLFLSALSLEGK